MNVNIKKVKSIKIIYIHIIKVLVTYLFFKSISLSYNSYNSKYNKNKQINSEINYIFKKFNKVNINDVYMKYYPTKKENAKIKSIINVEFTLDPNYILETMLTVTSIMANQKKTTKVIFHFGVISIINQTICIQLFEV